MNNVKLAVVLAILGIAAIGYGGFKFFSGEEVEYTLKCKESKEVFTLKVPVNSEFPIENPKTKAKTLYKAEPFYCTVTQKNVYMIPEQEEIPLTMEPGFKEGAQEGTNNKPVPPVVEKPDEN
jgi:hypothetical protein